MPGPSGWAQGLQDIGSTRGTDQDPSPQGAPDQAPLPAEAAAGPGAALALLESPGGAEHGQRGLRRLLGDQRAAHQLPGCEQGGAEGWEHPPFARCPMPKRFPQIPRLQAVPGVPGLAAGPALSPRECEDEDKAAHSRQALPAPSLPATLCPPPWGQISSKIQVTRFPGQSPPQRARRRRGLPGTIPFPNGERSVRGSPQGPAPTVLPFVLSSHCCSLNICLLYSAWHSLAGTDQTLSPTCALQTPPAPLCQHFRVC